MPFQQLASLFVVGWNTSGLPSPNATETLSLAEQFDLSWGHMTPAERIQDVRAATEPVKAPEPVAAPRRRRGMVVIAIAIVAVAAVLIWRGMFARSVPQNIIVLSG